MKKKTVLWVILDLIFLIVFNAVFFLAAGFSHPASVWISYGFIHFAYLMVIATPLLVRKSSSAAVFGFALATVSSVYFYLEFIVGMIFILVRSDNFKPALIVQIIVAGIYLIMLISNMIANETTADNIQRQEQEVAYIKEAASRVKPLIDRVSDKKASRAVESVYDQLHSSPSRSSESVHSLETSIMHLISDLEFAVSSQDNAEITNVSASLNAKIDERNRKLRLMN